MEKSVSVRFEVVPRVYWLYPPLNGLDEQARVRFETSMQSIARQYEKAISATLEVEESKRSMAAYRESVNGGIAK